MDDNQLTTDDLLTVRLNKLKTDFPEIFTEGKIDIEKFKATFTDDINFANERYVLNWAGKADAFKVLQIPTTATLIPCPGEGINDFPFLVSNQESGESFNQTNHGSDNVFIEGENLEVLKVLQKSYYGKIKCIIIDPPYNTGNDSFIYPDSFKENKADYEKRIGEKDEEGYLMKEGMFRKNSKDSGHYHSNWLSMMYPRLFLAKNLLREDGVIFIHIDDNEVHNLRMIMNEIFGEENFLAQVVWQRAYAPINLKKNFSAMHDFILVYSKRLDKFTLNPLPRSIKQDKDYKNPDNDFRGPWKVGNLSVGPPNEKQIYEIITPSGRMVMPPKGYCWRFTKERFEELVKDNRIWFGEKGDNVPTPKIFLNEVKEGVTPTTWWPHTEVGHNQDSMREVRELFGEAVFTNPKPVKLLKRILNLSTKSKTNDLILDFFAGSGATAQAVLELNKEDGGNRKFILVQLPELCDENSEAYKAGYKTIADISKERIRRVIKRLNHDSSDSGINMIKNNPQQKLFEQAENQNNQKNQTNHSADNGFKVFKLSPSNFKIWRGNEINEENLVQQLDAFTNPVKEGSKQDNMLFELMLKAGYLLTDKVVKKENFYSIKNGELLIAIESINQAAVDMMIASQPQKVITLDILFKDNDQLKTNTVLQMKDAEIDFKTI